MARIDPAVRRAVLAGLAAGQTMTALAATHGISINTVQTWKNQARDLNGTGTAAEGLLDAVLESTAILETPAMRGTAALAITIARRIVEAERIADEATQIDVSELGDNGVKQLAALQRRVDSVTILSELSPKLLAALTAIGGAMPKPTTGRAAPATPQQDAGGQGDDGQPAAPATALDKALARRAQRGATPRA